MNHTQKTSSDRDEITMPEIGSGLRGKIEALALALARWRDAPEDAGYEPGRWDSELLPGDLGDGRRPSKAGRRCKHCDGWESEHAERPDALGQSTTAGVAELSDEERQRRGFAFGNLKLANPATTREMIDRAAEAIDRERAIASEIARVRENTRDLMADLAPSDYEDGRALVANLSRCDEAETALLAGDIDGSRALLHGAETRREGHRDAIRPPPPRAERPSSDSFHQCARWSPTDWGCALAGEVGEACNLIKKLHRGDHVDRGAIAHELADVAIYLDILAGRLGIDLGAAVVEKFNIVSERVGSRYTLGEEPRAGQLTARGWAPDVTFDTASAEARRALGVLQETLGRIPNASEVRALMAHLDATRAELAAHVGHIDETGRAA